MIAYSLQVDQESDQIDVFSLGQLMHFSDHCLFSIIPKYGR